MGGGGEGKRKKKSVQILKSVNFWKNFGVKTNSLKN